MKQAKKKEVTRVEIIDHTKNGEGRVFTKWDIPKVELSYQDDGATLKIFLTEK